MNDENMPILRLAVLTFGAIAAFMLIHAGLGVVEINGWLRFDGGNGPVVGVDFYNFWTYGRAAWAEDPGRFYDHVVYHEYVEAEVGGARWTPIWSYPPTLMLIAAPFGLLPWWVALAAWTVLSIGFFLWAVRPWLTTHWHVALVLLAPAATLNLLAGQSAFFFAALLVAGFRLAGSRPIAAGMMFGLLTTKPQLGLVVPIALHMFSHRRAFAWAAVFAIVLNAGSVLLYGVQTWQEFLSDGISASSTVLNNNDRIAHAWMPSLFISLQILGLDVPVALGLQLCLVIGLIVMLERFKLTVQQPDVLVAAALLASLAATPYLMGYDLVAATGAVLVILAHWKLSRLDAATLLALLATPVITLMLGGSGLAGGCVTLLLGVWWLWRRAAGAKMALTANTAATA